MSQFENSEVVRHVLQKLFVISSRKTTQGNAVSLMHDSVKNLEKKYNFLKNVEIKDTRYIEMNEPISVMSNINSVKSNDIGKALSDLIKIINFKLGEEAGHFFIKELKNSIEDIYSPNIEEMGLDFGLMQLEFEVNKMVKEL